MNWTLSPRWIHHTPTIETSADRRVPDLRSILMEGPELHGKPTRAFGYLGMPTVEPGQKIPGVVLVHGGGGTAFPQWVRLWTQRGYAALALDYCGAIPHEKGDGGPHPRNPVGGPAGWDASFKTTDEKLDDQWPAHVATLGRLARNLLASLPGVDNARIGVTGISWGGYSTLLIAGASPDAFAFAIPVYGCGFLGDNSCWNDVQVGAASEPAWRKWNELWDPSHFIPKIACPTLWVSGTNDFAYPLDSLQKSHRLQDAGKRHLCIRPNMPHSHEGGWAPREIGAFADQVVAGGTANPRVTASGVEGGTIQSLFESGRPVVSAELVWTRATGYWSDRVYQCTPATLHAAQRRVEAVLPRLATTAYLLVQDESGQVASSEYWSKG